jgi:hypothetical protein
LNGSGSSVALPLSGRTMQFDGSGNYLNCQ